MTAEVTQLALAVDSTQVNAGASALDRLAASGGKAETASDRLEAAMRDAGAASALAAKEAQSASQRMEALLTGIQSAAQATASAFNRTRESTQRSTGETEKNTRANQEQAKAARLAAMQTQQLGFQLNDFFVQVSSGGSPLTALIQQGSQLSGVYGGVGAAFRAVTALFTVGRVAAAGVAGAVGGLALAAYQGAEQSNALQRALTLTGNAAGITEGQFASLSSTIAEATKTTIGSSRDTLQQLVATGRFSGDALRSAATATQLLSKVTGAATEDIVKNFVTLSGGVSRGAQSLNEQYNFLSAAQLRQIKTLEDQGRSQQAVAVTLDALNERLAATAINVGVLESAWSKAKIAVSDFWEYLLSIGRDTTAEDTLRTLEESVKRLRLAAENKGVASPSEFYKSLFGESFSQQADALQLQIDAARKAALAGQDAAKAQADAARTEQARIKFGNELEATYSRQKQLATEIARINALADASGASAADRASLIAAAVEKFEPGIPAARLQTYVGQIKNSLGILTNSYANAESILEANRSAGLVSETAYYAARRELIQANSQAQIRALQDENAALAKAQAERSGKMTQAEVMATQAKIAENTSRITTLTAEAAAKTAVLTTQQSAGVTQMERQYQQLADAQANYLENLARIQQRELSGAGIGNAERQRLAERLRIEDEFQKQRNDLNARKAGGAFDQKPEAYARELALLDSTLAQALLSYDSYQVQKLQGEQNASNGMREAIANYASEAQNAAGAVASAFTSGFRSIEDSLVNFLTTGKGGFKSLINTILAEALRLQAVRPLLATAVNFLSGLGGGGGIALGASDGAGGIFDGRAIGGPVSARGVYRINERRAPEVATFGDKSYLLTGNQSGTVKPLTEGSAGGGTSIVIQGDVGPRNLRAITSAIEMAEYRQMRRSMA